MDQKILYSVIIPLKDEEDNIESLVLEIETVMNALKKPWELICIDDASKDKTPYILKKLCDTKEYLKVITFKTNQGQSTGFSAGFKAALGDYVITIDGDGQNDPKDIPKLLELISEADLVCGWRVNRKDTSSKRFISSIANYFRSRWCQDGVHDTGCSLKVYRRSCLSNIKMYKGMHRFLPALFKIEGFRIKEVPVNHRPRTKGQSKYNFLNRSINVLFDTLAVIWMRKRHISKEFNDLSE